MIWTQFSVRSSTTQLNPYSSHSFGDFIFISSPKWTKNSRCCSKERAKLKSTILVLVRAPIKHYGVDLSAFELRLSWIPTPPTVLVIFFLFLNSSGQKIVVVVPKEQLNLYRAFWPSFVVVKIWIIGSNRCSDRLLSVALPKSYQLLLLDHFRAFLHNTFTFVSSQSGC